MTRMTYLLFSYNGSDCKQDIACQLVTEINYSFVFTHLKLCTFTSSFSTNSFFDLFIMCPIVYGYTHKSLKPFVYS